MAESVVVKTKANVIKLEPTRNDILIELFEIEEAL